MGTVGDQEAVQAPGEPGEETESRPARRRLTRSRQDRIFAGVVGGLAEYFDIDPVLLRVVFVVATVVGFGAGLPLYLLAWLVIPEEGRQESEAARLLRSGGWLRPALAVGLLALGALLLAVSFPFDGGLVALGLIGAGIFLLVSHKDGTAPSPLPAPPDSGSGEGAAVPSQAGAHPSPSVSSPASAPPAMSHPPRARSALAPVTLSLLLILGGIAWLLDDAGVIDVSLLGFLIFALAVVGAALVVGAWWGRARWLILVGLALLVAIGVSWIVPPALHLSARGGGDVYLHPEDPAGLEDAYRLGAGQLTLDLADLSFPEGTTAITASIGMGELTVIVPSSISVVAEAQVGMGRMDLLGESAEGTRLVRRIVRAGTGDDARQRLVLTLRAGMGVVEVRRAA